MKKNFQLPNESKASSTRDEAKPQRTLIFNFLILSGLILATPVLAVELYLEPSYGEYQPGDTFITEIRIDTEAKCINAADINLSFSQDILEAIDFSKGDSILTLWVKEPALEQNLGLISFAGGIPGGYCGILPGDPREASALGRIVFRARKDDRGPISASAKVEFLDTSQVLLNDGLGTSAKLTLKGATFTVLPEKAEVPKDEWLQELEKDNIPPESFEIEIHQDPAIFEGKYFIVFSTTDKQTGIDYYEIIESRKQKIENRMWKRVESPYLLEDQTLQSIIKVRAVDKAGNERIAEYLPPKEPFPWWIIVLILAGVGVILWMIYQKIKKSKIKKFYNL